jgi:hypothetical protein
MSALAQHESDEKDYSPDDQDEDKHAHGGARVHFELHGPVELYRPRHHRKFSDDHSVA